MDPDAVASNVPAVMVNILAIPKVELADNCNFIPLMTTLKRLAVPLRVDVLVNVTVPADADNVPVTVSAEETEKSASAVMEPVTSNAANNFVPVPDIVFEAPLMVMFPVLAVKLPLTDKLPLISRELVVLTVPLTVRLSNIIPVPLIVLPLPVISNVPPETKVNEPDKIVARLPVTVNGLAGKPMEEAAIVRLLKF